MPLLAAGLIVRLIIYRPATRGCNTFHAVKGRAVLQVWGAGREGGESAARDQRPSKKNLLGARLLRGTL